MKTRALLVNPEDRTVIEVLAGDDEIHAFFNNEARIAANGLFKVSGKRGMIWLQAWLDCEVCGEEPTWEIPAPAPDDAKYFNGGPFLGISLVAAYDTMTGNAVDVPISAKEFQELIEWGIQDTENEPLYTLFGWLDKNLSRQ